MPRDELQVGPSGALMVVTVYDEGEDVPPATAEEAIANERADGDADPEGTARLNHPHLFGGKGDHDGNGEVGGSLRPEGDDLPGLRAQYQTKFGKRPFMGWSADQLREKLA